ncbi:MAG: TonB-dependent receptor plug domain-containing protein, partial [Gammaproteobacteria bacterium]|nr:TonB-dependent receptor plug domain-containing protein [Gammaproteobacteria bacterium]
MMNLYKLHSSHTKLSTISITSIIAFTLSMPLQANEDDLFFEMPVVLSASRLEQAVSEAPIAITSIDRQIIEASGARTIPEILRLVPGVVIGSNANEWGEEAKQVVTYHGHTDQYSKQMQVLIDGRSIYEPIIGGVNWNMIPINIEDIERIEVSRGPNASTFGSNSFLAVINIITRHASEDQGHYVKARAGNHDIADLTYRYGGSNGDLDYRITATTQNDDGLDAKKNLNTYASDGNVVTRQYSNEIVENHDDIGTGAIDYRIDYQINNNSRLTYQGGYGKTDLEIKKNYASDGIKPQRESDTINAHQFIKLENTVDDNNSFIIQYYYNLQNKTDQSRSNLIEVGAPIDDFSLDLDFGFKSERHNLEFTHFNQTTDNLRLIWGVSAQQDIAKSPYWLYDQGTIRREIYRLFANAEWQINQN